MYNGWKGGVSYGGPALTHTEGIELPFWESEPVTERVTEAIYIDWPDFGTPADKVPIKALVQWMVEQLAAGKTLETGCMGGHGRTGTLLALLLCAQGVTPPEAIERVRDKHCKKGIENEKQAKYVGAFYKAFHGNEQWRQSKPLRKRFDKAVKDGHKNYTPGKATGYISISQAEKVWDKKLQCWTSKTWEAGYTWDSALKLYTKKGKEVTTSL